MLCQPSAPAGVCTANGLAKRLPGTACAAPSELGTPSVEEFELLSVMRAPPPRTGSWTGAPARGDPAAVLGFGAVLPPTSGSRQSRDVGQDVVEIDHVAVLLVDVEEARLVRALRPVGDALARHQGRVAVLDGVHHAGPHAAAGRGA